MYAETGLLFPYFQNTPQDFQQLEEFCRHQKFNASMVPFFSFNSFIYTYLLILINFEILVFNFLVDFAWSALIWFVLRWDSVERCELGLSVCAFIVCQTPSTTLCLSGLNYYNPVLFTKTKFNFLIIFVLLLLDFIVWLLKRRVKILE